MSQTHARKRGTEVVRLCALVLLIPLLIPWVVLILVGFFIYASILYLVVWLSWLPRGKDVLLVYSESPIWHDYMVSEVLPLVKHRAIVLNWSERSQWRWWSLPVRAFRLIGGDKDFNPMVVLFRPLRLARTFRFWSAFKEWKHGDREPVESLRRELALSL